MITGDIGAEIARLLRVGAEAGELPDEAVGVSVAGTWRRAPTESGRGPGTYATSVPLELASRSGHPAKRLAAYLARGLSERDWIACARVTGNGYLTVTVTASHLAALASRIVAAGPRSGASSALAGRKVTAPSLPDPAAATDWHEAWRTYGDAVWGRLADAAGAEVLFLDFEQGRPAASPARSGSVQGRADTVAGAVAYYGADAVRYALARTRAPRASAIGRQLTMPLDLANPFFAVRYAHADAASTLRWAAELGLDSVMDDSAKGDSTLAAVHLLAAPELSLLDIMSWLPERVAAAARLRRPAELTSYLEQLADAWLNCRESCAALPFYGAAAPDVAAGTQTAARLTLAAGAQVAIASGLSLLGIAAPSRT